VLLHRSLTTNRGSGIVSPAQAFVTGATYTRMSPLREQRLRYSRRGYHFPVVPVENLEVALSAWMYPVEAITPLAGGWNSTTWLVITASGRFVAKLVDDLDAPALVSGLRIAEFLAARGLPCGAPVRTRDGQLTISLQQGALALLRHEPGTPPDLSVPSQVRRAGQMLARAHNALRDFPAESDPRYIWPWQWVNQCLDTIAMSEHVNAAARRIWPEIIRTVAEHQLSISIIHADPGPDAFLLGGTGDPDDGHGDARDALIDWTTTLRGPMLYDLACFAVMTRHSAPQAARSFTEGYAAELPEIRPQLVYLDCLVKARWLANAIYFASRIERGIERGSTSPTANQDGLAEAYAGITAGKR
jgi:Ser/Thr protein kinase RdoA (MazF antagonist)